MLGDSGAVPLAVEAPHPLVDPLLAQHNPGILGEQGQDIELLSGQGDLLAPETEGPVRIVDGQLLVEPDAGRGGPAAVPPQAGRHLGLQHRQRDRLGDVLVAPGGKAAELVLVPPQGGEKEDGTGHVPPDPAADLQPAHIRQHHVQQDQIRPGGGLLQSLPAAAGGGHLVSRPAEVAGQLVPQGFLIIHDQQSVRHCPSSPRSTG